MPLPLLELKPYVAASRIIFFEEPVLKHDVLEQLSSCAAEDETVTDTEAFRNAIFEREEVSSTGIGRGVAVPHAKIETNTGFSITIGIARHGIDYDASDEQPVYVLFMIAATDQERKAYLQLLATVAKLLKQESVYSALCDASDPQDVLAALDLAT